MSDVIIVKRVDRILLTDGFTFTVEDRRRLISWFGEIKSGESKDVKIRLNGENYPVRLDCQKLAGHDEIYQIRYIAPFKIRVALQKAFMRTALAIDRELERCAGNIQAAKKQIDIPYDARGLLILRRTDDNLVWEACVKTVADFSSQEIIELRDQFELWMLSHVENRRIRQYIAALRDTTKCREYAYEHPLKLPHEPIVAPQNITPELFPVSTVYEFRDPNEVLAIWKNSERAYYRDSGDLKSALGFYCLFLRLRNPYRWGYVDHLPGDNGRINSMLELKNYDYKSNLEVAMAKTQKKQLIVYGAPGTGKSFFFNEETLENIVIRTTFHPDSDYSTFVGAYKPTMEGGKIAYAFRPQAFMNAYVAAWKEMTKGTAGKPVVLVIEEINRGNCAQIFGDLFQLLDRGDDGYSTYPIDADTDLAKWLKSDEKDENNQLLRFGSAGLGLTKPTDQTFKMKQSDWDAVMIGKKLALPPNLYIWATMNTSDQSLFPIDSAFKRRWDWKYVPIREGKYKDGPKKEQELGWKIKFTVPAHQEGSQQIPAKDYSYDWWEFLKNINAKIFKTTESEDKKLGYFFVKPDGEDAATNDGTISADRFVSKVIFYLWNDVFKDYGIETIFKVDDAKKSEDEAKGVEFQAFFNEEDDKADVNTLLRFFKHIELKSDAEIAAAQAAQQQPTASAANQQGQNTNP